MNPNQQQPDSDSLVAALAERLDTEVHRISVTARLALAETRLAASSAGLLLLCVLMSAALLFVCWLLLMALVWHGLQALHLTAAGALAVLLALHVATIALLLLASWRMSRHLAFTHTRRALTRTPPSTATADKSV